MSQLNCDPPSISIRIVSQLRLFFDLGPSEPADEHRSKFARDQIVELLSLDDNEKQDEILNDLFTSGLSSLTKYKEYLFPDIYDEFIVGENSRLTACLKSYHEEQWKLRYEASCPWFVQFLNRSKTNEHSCLYDQTLENTIKHGNKYMKTCPMLSITMQILFENLLEFENTDDESVYDELWFTVTHDGLQSIEKYSEFLLAETIDEQLNSEQSILFQVLREFYRAAVIKVFQENKISNRANLHELALDNIARLGWLDGLKRIQNKFIPKNFQILFEKMQIYLKDERQSFEEQSKSFRLAENPKDDRTRQKNREIQSQLGDFVTRLYEADLTRNVLVAEIKLDRFRTVFTRVFASF